MGVDGLYRFINKRLPDTFNSVSINEIRNKSCIIDGMQHIYSQLIYLRTREKEIFTENGKNISHIHGLINSLTYYLKNGIVPIFIFDGKSPDIKKKKIEERKKNLQYNLLRLKELENKKQNISNLINNLELSELKDMEEDIENIRDIEEDNCSLIFGTPPVDSFNLEDEISKINNIDEEYRKIYKKSIILKDYYISDWIEILELLGLPVIKAVGEADPLCSYILKNNSEIFGILSDDSDMLVFGAPILMRKSVNQHFTIIKLEKILEGISELLTTEYDKKISFILDNLIDFAILLGTDYGIIKLNKNCYDSYDILKYYIENDKDYKKIILYEQYEEFLNIKKYYSDLKYGNEYEKYLEKPQWKKPKLMELKDRLLQLNVDEDFIDKNNEFLDKCYNRIKKENLYVKDKSFRINRFKKNEEKNEENNDCVYNFGRNRKVISNNNDNDSCEESRKSFDNLYVDDIFNFEN